MSQPRPRKTKRAAILWSVFVGPFALLYTYRQSKRDFWTCIILCIITFGFFYPVAWMLTLYDRLHRPASFYKTAGASFSRKTRIILWGLTITFVVCIITICAVAVARFEQQQNQLRAAVIANAQRLAADPVNVPNLFNALNKERTSVGAPALATVTNLQTAAEQMCNDMVASNYLAYTNPATGKEANSFITDNQASLYYKTYVSSIYRATSQQTATDAVIAAVKTQATNLNSPSYNSVGWATCPGPSSTVDVVAMLADNEQKPVAPQVVNHYYPVYTPSYSSSINCTSYTDFVGETHTSCY